MCCGIEEKGCESADRTPLFESIAGGYRIAGNLLGYPA